MWEWRESRDESQHLQALGYAFPHAYGETGPDILAPPWGTPALAQVEQLFLSLCWPSQADRSGHALRRCPLLLGSPPPHPNLFLWSFVSP